MKNIIKNTLKQLHGLIYRLLLPILVRPPGMLYKGNYYTIPRLKIIHFLEDWKTRVHGKVLDVGVGSWELPRRLLRDVCDYTSTDYYEHPNVDIVSDIYNLTQVFPENSFDFVICTDVIEHLAKPWLAVKELRAVLKSGGTLLLSTPFNYHIHKTSVVTDYWRISEDGIRELLMNEAGFHQIDITPIGPPEFPFSHLVVAVK